MIVVARELKKEDCPATVRPFATPGQVAITKDQSYEVCAMALFEGVLLVQIVDDLRYPAWVPTWFFSVKDSSMPRDWICNVFRDEPMLVVGPTFMARDLESYGRMVELQPDAVGQFWKRLDALGGAKDSEQ